MAGFCSKCGAPLAPDTQFCAACGTPAAVSAATPAASAPPAAPPQSGGSSALKIVLIVIAIIFGLGILAAGAFGFFVWRVAHSVHVNNNGEVSINTPAGHLSANSTENFTASDLGTDIYPGAESGKGGMRMTLPTGTMVSAVYVTSDSKDKVLAFYKSKLTGNVSTFDTVNGSVITYNRDQQESIVITVTSDSSEYDGKTQIHIVHTTKSS
ncbi:MAG TPA: zinc ribbon domain-containing protein [Terracidiphilus sp.]|nr:zinc ribbon domain-containing protein [Terracidiphilus sp.]